MSTTVSVGKAPRIEVPHVSGNLSVVGFESEDVLITADEDELHLEHEGERVTLNCDGDVALRLPPAANVSIGHVEGEMSLRGLTGPVQIKQVGADLAIRNVSSVSVESVRGDFSLRAARGSLHVEGIGGDASIRDVDGDLTLESVSGDLALRDVRGNILAKVGDDVVLYLNPQAGSTCTVTAADDILLVLPPGADATLNLHGDQVHLDWPGMQDDLNSTHREITLGKGSAHVQLQAGGEVRVSSRPDAGDRADEFGNFAGMNFDWSGFGQKIGRRVEEVARRAEKKAASAWKRVESHVGRWPENWGPGAGFASSGPAAPVVSEEERLMVLRMLQEKKITAEQAEKLLAALEGVA